MTLKKTNGSEKLQIDLMVNDQVLICDNSYSHALATARLWLSLNAGRTMSSFRLLLYLQPVDPGEAYQDMAAENDEVSVDVGVQFNASVMKGEQSLV